MDRCAGAAKGILQKTCKLLCIRLSIVFTGDKGIFKGNAAACYGIVINASFKQLRNLHECRRIAQNVANENGNALFLGGVGEIGKNMTLFECEGDMVLVDCGMAFPDGDMLGVDLVIPDFTYIEQNINKLRGVVLTHGHEDHVGGLLMYGIPNMKLDKKIIDRRVDLMKAEGVEFKATITTYPEVELGAYKGLKVEKVIPVVTDEEVDEEIGRMADRNARVRHYQTGKPRCGGTLAYLFVRSAGLLRRGPYL